MCFFVIAGVNRKFMKIAYTPYGRGRINASMKDCSEPAQVIHSYAALKTAYRTYSAKKEMNFTIEYL